jgi:hypothetical protein
VYNIIELLRRNPVQRIIFVQTCSPSRDHHSTLSISPYPRQAQGLSPHPHLYPIRERLKITITRNDH